MIIKKHSLYTETDEVIEINCTNSEFTLELKYISCDEEINRMKEVVTGTADLTLDDLKQLKKMITEIIKIYDKPKK